ncbi:MAG: adenylate kinase [Pseudomonadota bacterium]
MNTVFLGPPGAGKGTQALLISKRFRMRHISTGELLREAIEKGNELGQKARNHIDGGHLVPDDTMIDLIRKVLPSTGDFLLDGFPRTLNQAEALDEMLSTERRKLDLAIYLDVSDEIAGQRLMGRHRADDRPETIRERLVVYHRETEPVVDYYGKTGRLRKIDASPPRERVTETISQELGAGK